MRARLETTWPHENSHARESPPNAQSRDWRFPSRLVARSTPSLAASRRIRSLSGSLRHLRNPVQERGKHPAPFGVPVGVAEGVLVKVRLQALGRNAPINSANPTLQERPE